MKKAGVWLVNRLFSVVFSLLLLVSTIELFWYNSTPEQRKHWLEISPRPWLADYLELQKTNFIIPQLFQLIQNPPHTIVVSEDVVKTPEPSPQTVVSKEQESVFTPGIKSAAHHSGKCVKPPTQKITDVDPQAIYRWKDENGQVHFGDNYNKKTRQQTQDLSKTYGRQTQGIKLTLDFKGWQGDSRLESELHKEASLMYRILTRYIPKEQWRQINLNLVIFRNQAAFEGYKQQQQANAGWVAYYDGRRNQAFMAMQPNHQSTMRIARHEMTHAMMLGMLGSTPIWISEGLAQYIERLRWQLSSAQIEVDQAAFEQLPEHSAAYQFSAMAAMSHQQFNGENQQQHYAQSAAMMHFLLGHREGQQWLKTTLGYFAQNPCGSYQANAAFQQSYPGGLAAAGQKYQRWLAEKAYRTHYY